MKLRSRDKLKAAGKPPPAKKAQRAKANKVDDAKRTAQKNSTAKKSENPPPSSKQPPKEYEENFDNENPDWLSTVEDKERRQGFLKLHRLIRKLAPNLEPTTDFHCGLIGYGPCHYKYKSGREGDHVKITLANNKQHMALHCCGLLHDEGRHVVESFADRLVHSNATSKISTGKLCVRFKRFSDLNRPVLEELITAMATCDILS